MRLANQVIDVGERVVAHAERRQIESRRILVQQSQYDALACPGRQRRDAHIDLLVAELERDSTILRQSLFRNIETRHDLESRHERGM